MHFPIRADILHSYPLNSFQQHILYVTPQEFVDYSLAGGIKCDPCSQMYLTPCNLHVMPNRWKFILTNELKRKIIITGEFILFVLISFCVYALPFKCRSTRYSPFSVTPLSHQSVQECCGSNKHSRVSSSWKRPSQSKNPSHTLDWGIQVPSKHRKLPDPHISVRTMLAYKTKLVFHWYTSILYSLIHIKEIYAVIP